MVLIDEQTRECLKKDNKSEGQIILHCRFTSKIPGDIFCIDRDTYLYPNDMDIESRLLLAENIPLRPDWRDIKVGETIEFTLIFEPLPAFCRSFDLCEDIPDEMAIMLLNIRRNEEDIYYVEIE